MKKGITLIELIFTIMIIAIVFTVIPKLIFALNKSDSFAIRQDALLNGVSMLNMISNMPWDKNNTDSSDILHSSSLNFECNSTTYYRVGGFKGSRRCEDNLSASIINKTLNNEDDIWDLDNIGDFNNTEVNVTANGIGLYDLNISVNYIDDNIYYNSQTAIIILADDINKSSTNLKKIDMDIYYSGKRGKRRKLAKFSYVSTNIGLIEINKREWQ